MGGMHSGSIAGWVEAVHGMLMDGATWGSGMSGRKRGASEVDGMVGDDKGVGGVGCVATAREVNVGDACALSGGVDVDGCPNRWSVGFVGCPGRAGV